jgi:hypothetical protein
VERGSQLYGRLEAGLYVVRAVGSSKSAPAPAHVLVSVKESVRAPLALGAPVPAEVPFEQRDLRNWFPQLAFEDVSDSDEYRQELFLAAPRALFVFPKLDLDGATARFDARIREPPGAAAPVDPIDYPKKDEPVLRLGAQVLAADGNLYQVAWNELAAAPSGPPPLPTTPRNPRVGFEFMMKVAPKSDQPAIAAYQRVEGRHADCLFQSQKRTDHEIAVLRNAPPSVRREREMARLEDEGARNVRAHCDATEVDRAKAALAAALTKSRTARRASALGPVRKRLQQLFARTDD